MTHTQLVKSLKKSPHSIWNSMEPTDCDLNHMALGIAGEAGEIVDCVKKHTIYEQPLNIENLREEIGDMLFYLEGMCQAAGLTLEDCKQHNIEKLTVRYGEKYSDRAAAERKDKK